MSTHLFGLVDTAFTYSHSVGRNEFNGTGFRNPVDMAIDEEGKVYVLNRSYENRPDGVHATIATLDEQFVGEFSKFGEAPGDMYWPTACALDGAGNLYVADEWLNRITIYDGDGEYLRHWGEQGHGPGQFNGPSGIAIDGDTLWLVDSKNHRVQSYGLDGAFKSQFGGFGSENGQFNLPWGICLDQDGMIYVADWRNDRVQQFTQAGDWQATFGMSGSGPGQFKRPNAVFVDQDGDIYVCDRGERPGADSGAGRPVPGAAEGRPPDFGVGQEQAQLQPGYDSPAHNGDYPRRRGLRKGFRQPLRRPRNPGRADCGAGPHAGPHPGLSEGAGAGAAVIATLSARCPSNAAPPAKVAGGVGHSLRRPSRRNSSIPARRRRWASSSAGR